VSDNEFNKQLIPLARADESTAIDRKHCGGALQAAEFSASDRGDTAALAKTDHPLPPN